MSDKTARELYETSFDGSPPCCPWERLPPEAKANWERIVRERLARIAAGMVRR